MTPLETDPFLERLPLNRSSSYSAPGTAKGSEVTQKQIDMGLRVTLLIVALGSSMVIALAVLALLR